MKPRHIKNRNRTGIAKADIHEAAQQHRLWMELAESRREKAREHVREARRGPMYEKLSMNHADSERKLAEMRADEARFRRKPADRVRSAPCAKDEKTRAGARKARSADQGGR